MKNYAVLLLATILLGCSAETEQQEQTTPPSTPVQWVSAMRHVMHKGLIGGAVSVDTLKQEHLYGLGPTEYLGGELMLLDGTYYIATVGSQDQLQVHKGTNAKPPFFVYANINSWKEQHLPDSISTIAQLENYLDAIAGAKPFFFKVKGQVDSAMIHNVNLHAGVEVHSPDDAHQDLIQFPVGAESITLLGVYSTEHAGVFIHHDAHTHIHLITADEKAMGHLDDLWLQPGATIYLQEQ